MTSNNNMGSYNKLEKLEEKKELELQFLKIKYELSANEVTIIKNEKVTIDGKNITIKKNKNVIIDYKNIKEIEKEFVKLLNKCYTFGENMKKKFIVKNRLNRTEFNKNEKMLLKYQKLHNEQTELSDAIQKFREYRDKAIGIRCYYDELIEIEIQILTKKREKEKRFKNNLKKETRKIHESNLDDSILDGDKKIIK